MVRTQFLGGILVGGLLLSLPAAGDAAAVAAAGAGAGALFEVEIAPFALCPPRSASGGSSAGSSKGGDGGKGGDGRAGTASGGAQRTAARA